MVDSANASGPVQRVAALRPASSKAAAPARPKPTLADRQGLVRQAAAIADQGPPVDYLKLAQIRAALFRGDYPINSRAIADAIAMQAHL